MGKKCEGWRGAELVIRLTGFKGGIAWDTSRPGGQPRRCLDVSRAEQLFGFRAQMDFEEGLRRTIEWYRGVRYGKRGAVSNASTAALHRSKVGR